MNVKKADSFVLLHDYAVSSLPRVARLEVSSFCNLRCIHCPTGIKIGDKRGNMSLEVFYRIVDEIKKYNGVDVIVLYHGGESFLNRNIFEMIEVFSSMKIPRIQANTNGCLLDDDMLIRIIDSGLTRIEFSIDGLSPKENNQIRRGADYHKVVAVIKKLLMLKRQRPLRNLEVFIVNAQIPTEQQVRAGEQAFIPEFLLNDFTDFKDEIVFKSSYIIKWPGFDCSDKYKIIEYPHPECSKPLNFCDHIIELITFRWNGDVVPCCYDITGEYIIGNIMQNSLEELWNNDKYKTLRKSIDLRKFIPLCAYCNEVQPISYVTKTESNTKV